MLTRLSIRGFRGLRELTLDQAGRVNLIVGRNDTGKTTVLEAIRLLLTGNPRNMRRVNRNLMDRPRTTFEESLELAFYCGKADQGIRIDGDLGSFKLRASVGIENNDHQERMLIEPSDSEEEDPGESLLQPSRKIVVRIAVDEAAFAIVSFPLEENSLRRASIPAQRSFEGHAFPEMPGTVWLGTNRAEVWSYARRFSRLSDDREDGPLIELLRRIEPRLRGLKVSVTPRESATLGGAVLKADLEVGPLLPLESMGDGFASTIAIMTAVASAAGGLCLIDEVENGIHYSILPSVWKAIADTAESYNAQVWATTHSLDCVSAAHEAFSNRPDDLRVHRFSRKDDGAVKVHTFDYAMLTQALESGLEVR